MEPSTLFDDAFLQKLEYLKIVSSRLLPGHLKGEHRSKKKGSGLEFADFRPYVSGDDTRNVDWRAYLRLDRLILRLFEEEADLPIYIFIDSSHSMEHGSPSKFDYARKVAAALCYIGLLNLDRVNIVAYADGVAEELDSCRGKNQVWRAFHFLESVTPAGTTRLEKALRSFFSVKRRRGLVVVVSDFLDASGLETGFNLLRYFRHDVFAVHIMSPEEARPELPDEVILEDSENGSTERIKVTPGLLTAYLQQQEAHCRALESYCLKYGWGYTRALTQVPFEDLILQVFRQDRFLG
jgi:uncharacterized protein (DUF58 family)